MYLAPESPQAQNTLGTLLQAVGHPDQARLAFERGLTLDPSAAYILNNLCYLEFVEGNMDDAQTACQNAIERDSSLAAAHTNLAIIYFSQGRDALAWQALQGTGEIWTALYNLGVAHMARGKHEAAAAAFAATSQAKPDWAEPRNRAKQARIQMLDAQKPH